MGRRTNGHVLVVGSCLLAAVTGCGSTVAGSGAQLSGMAGSSGLQGAAAGSGLGPPGGGLTSDGSALGKAGSGNQTESTSTRPGAAGGVAAPGSANGVASGGNAGAAGPGRALSGSSGPAPGLTATAIRVGVPYTANGEAANAALGAGAITRGDEKAYMQAVIDDVNGRGGVAGKKLEPVFYAYDAQSADSKDAQDQAACATFTEDNRVFLVLGSGFTENFDACLQKAGVLKIASGKLIAEDGAYFRKYPTVFNLSVASQDRIMADQVSTLARLKYFSGWNPATGQPGSAPVKVGIISVDTPTWSRPLRSVLLPRLAAAGHAVDAANVVEVHNPQNSAETGRTVSDLQNATLRFQSNGVTHVVILDANGSLTLLWAPNAKNQRYFPRLGVNSATGMQALKDSGVLGNDQLNGAVGLGWFPSLDIPAAETPRYATTRTKRCLDLIQRATGKTFTSTNAASLALTKCDMGWLFEHAAKALQSLTLQTATAALEAVAGSYVPALTPAAFVSRSQHDAITQGYDMKWDTSCTCTKYVGQHRIP